jgi:DNA-binding Lrp family transcriptional regulator
MKTQTRAIPLMDVVAAFRETKDQRLTADRLGCTHQNVSTRLRQALRLGLIDPREFRANHRRIDTITSTEVWLTIMKVGKRFEDVAAALGLNPARFGRLLQRLPDGYAIKQSLVDDRRQQIILQRQQSQRDRALERYVEVARKIGRLPSSTDLQQKTGLEGRAAYARIHRAYGGMTAFFDETGI